MGCVGYNNTKVKSKSMIKSTDQESAYHVRSYYDSNKAKIPKRIRDLFENHLNFHPSSITSIDLRFLSLSANYLQPLLVILPYYSNVSLLDLWKVKLGDEGCRQVSEIIIKFEALQFLSIADNHITNVGISSFAKALQHLRGLEILKLHVNPINDEGIICLLPELTQMKRLRVLYLDECGLGGKGLEEVFKALQEISDLERLSIDFNEFTREAYNVLFVSIKRCKKLKRISMKTFQSFIEPQNSLITANPQVMLTFS